MPYRETPAQVRASLERARREGLVDACLAAERKKKLPVGILLAISSRETHCKNVVGDGGHGRGYFQIDDRSHQRFLARHGAAGPGGIPPLKEAAEYAAQIVVDNLAFARRLGVPKAQELRFALAAYNCGAGNARDAFRAGDCDAKTANRNYSRDVLERWEIVKDWLGAKVPRPELREGSRGKAVLELKRKLVAWMAVPPPFAMTPVWGKPLTEVVKDFQRMNGLRDDGVVGKRTWAALDRVKERVPA